jgi:hypothetical protein
MLAGFSSLDRPWDMKLVRQWIVNRIDIRVGE